MLSKCANPQCNASFQYLRDGKLFQIEIGGGPRLVTDNTPQSRVEYFWLCTGCAASMTLAYQHGKGVSAIPLHGARRAAAS